MMRDVRSVWLGTCAKVVAAATAECPQAKLYSARSLGVTLWLTKVIFVARHHLWLTITLVLT